MNCQINLKVETDVQGYHIFLVVQFYQRATNLALDGHPDDACAMEHREVCRGCSGWIPAATECLGVASCAGRVGSGAEEDALPEQRSGVLQEVGVCAPQYPITQLAAAASSFRRASAGWVEEPASPTNLLNHPNPRSSLLPNPCCCMGRGTKESHR